MLRPGLNVLFRDPPPIHTSLGYLTSWFYFFNKDVFILVGGHRCPVIAEVLWSIVLVIDSPCLPSPPQNLSMKRTGVEEPQSESEIRGEHEVG